MLGVISCGRVEAQVKPVTEAKQQAEPPAEKTAQVREEPVQTESPVVPEATPEAVAEIPQSVAQQAEGCTVEANGYKIEVKSVKVEEAYTGGDMLVVCALFTNNSTATVRFWDFASVKVSQNGRAIGDNVIFAGEKYMNATESVSPGQTMPIYVPFEMCEKGSPVDVTVSINNFASASILASGTCSLSLN